MIWQNYVSLHCIFFFFNRCHFVSSDHSPVKGDSAVNAGQKLMIKLAFVFFPVFDSLFV